MCTSRIWNTDSKKASCNSSLEFFFTAGWLVINLRGPKKSICEWIIAKKNCTIHNGVFVFLLHFFYSCPDYDKLLSYTVIHTQNTYKCMQPIAKGGASWVWKPTYYGLPREWEAFLTQVFKTGWFVGCCSFQISLTSFLSWLYSLSILFFCWRGHTKTAMIWDLFQYPPATCGWRGNSETDP